MARVGGLFKANRLLYLSTLGLRAIKKKVGGVALIMSGEMLGFAARAWFRTDGWVSGHTDTPLRSHGRQDTHNPQTAGRQVGMLGFAARACVRLGIRPTHVCVRA